MIQIEFDFETSCELDLQEVGAWVYSLHPSCRVLVFSFMHNGEIISWREKDPIPEILLTAKIKAHNWLFEYSIWNNVLTKHGFPPKPPEDFDCSMAQCYQATYPGKMEKAAPALGLSVGKDMVNRRTMLNMAANPAKNFPESDWAKLIAYNQNDVIVESMIADALPALQEIERPIFEFDKIINLRGIPIDLPAVKTAKIFMDLFEIEKLSRFRELTGLETPNELAKLLVWSNERGARLGTMQAAEIDAALTYLSGEVKEALEIRRMTGLTSVKKINAMLNTVEGGRIRGALQYHAASTGRWGGRLIQPQNLTKDHEGISEFVFELLRIGNYELFKSHFPNVWGALSASIRGFIKAEPGNKVIAGDFSAVESRGVFWCAEDEVGLELYRGEGKAYEAMAADIYEKEISAINKMERQLGKQAILGGGFGMGPGKFQGTCANYDIKISIELSQKIIYAYRNKFKKVVNFWYAMQDAAIAAVETGRATKVTKFFYKCEGGFLKCKLPSGRILFYPKPFITVGERGKELNYYGVDAKTKQWKSQRSWGGVLTENAVQSVARDLMVHAMFNLESAGYSNILTVHDEIICEVKKDFGNPSEFESIMNKLPAWAQGFPIASEAWEGERFRK